MKVAFSISSLPLPSIAASPSPASPAAPLKLTVTPQLAADLRLHPPHLPFNATA